MGTDSRRTGPLIVAHDGELEDVCQLLRTLGADWKELRGALPSRQALDGACAAIATPQRMLEGRFPPCSSTLRVAIVERSTRTLLSTLRRAGVQRIVSRPVHPAALRALVLHALYCGPEKRRRERVSVGAPIRFRTGLLPRGAILAELSVRGCRLLTRHAAKRDSTLRVSIPARLTGSGALSLAGRVVRTGPASGEDAGTQSIAVVFSNLTRPQMIALQRVVDAYSAGPATMDRGAPSERRAPASAPAARPAPEATGPAEPSATPAPVRPSEAATAPASAAATATPPEPPEQTPADRRDDSRRVYEHSLIALGHEAARVLMGRDISRTGMRVDSHPDLAVGDRLRVALHIGARTEPVVVEGRVDRDDGDRGLFLRFVDLPEGAAEAVQKLISGLPLLASSEPVPDSEDAGDASETIVSEILELTQG